MRIAILSDSTSIHTYRWVKSLSERGCEIMLISLLKDDLSRYKNLPGVEVFSFEYDLSEKSFATQWFLGKAIYFLSIKKIKKLIKYYKPDILHAHYASSFGLIGALTHFHPYVVSVWGSDVYEYPLAGKIYRKMLEYSLRCSDYLLSTSHCMAKETGKYTDKNIYITPFGVDLNLFRPLEKSDRQSFTIGNIKSLRPVYGIDTLIRAFALLKDCNPELDLRLQIAGEGPAKGELLQLCKDLSIQNNVEFIGFIANDKLPEVYNQLDVAVFLSRKESFGVAAIEAMACECPVVTSNADGYLEVVEDGVSGFIVESENPAAAAQSIQRLIDDKCLRRQIGSAGRKRAETLFDWNKNVDTMLEIYRQVLN